MVFFFFVRDNVYYQVDAFRFFLSDFNVVCVWQAQQKFCICTVLVKSFADLKRIILASLEEIDELWNWWTVSYFTMFKVSPLLGTIFHRLTPKKRVYTSLGSSCPQCVHQILLLPAHACMHYRQLPSNIILLDLTDYPCNNKCL